MCQFLSNMKRAFLEGLRQGSRDGSGSSRRVQRRDQNIVTPVDYNEEFVSLLRNPKISDGQIMAAVAGVLEGSEDPLQVFAILERLVVEHRPSLAPTFKHIAP